MASQTGFRAFKGKPDPIGREQAQQGVAALLAVRWWSDGVHAVNDSKAADPVRSKWERHGKRYYSLDSTALTTLSRFPRNAFIKSEVLWLRERSGPSDGNRRVVMRWRQGDECMWDPLYNWQPLDHDWTAVIRREKDDSNHITFPFCPHHFL